MVSISGILRHAPKSLRGKGEREDCAGHRVRIQTTLDLHADEDLDEMIAAQEKFLDAGGFESGSVR